MIRKALPKDAEKILNIWLNASIQAHDFINADYWKAHIDEVRDIYLPQAVTFVYEDKHQLKGFISIIADNFIGALFVSPQQQKKRIGSKLLEFVRRNKTCLTLRVYAKNKAALRFYQKNGFKIIAENIEEETGEAELTMSWAKGCKSGLIDRLRGDS